MAHNFKVGDMVRCIDARNYAYLTYGKIYEITAVGSIHVAVQGVTSTHYADRFELVDPVKISEMHIDISFAQTGRTPDIDIEGRLMATWLAVPANCCRACSAPLPCAYHPNG